jgi:hypothetical protein
MSKRSTSKPSALVSPNTARRPKSTRAQKVTAGALLALILLQVGDGVAQGAGESLFQGAREHAFPVAPVEQNQPAARPRILRESVSFDPLELMVGIGNKGNAPTAIEVLVVSYLVPGAPAPVRYSPHGVYEPLHMSTSELPIGGFAIAHLPLDFSQICKMGFRGIAIEIDHVNGETFRDAAKKADLRTLLDRCPTVTET